MQIVFRVVINYVETVDYNRQNCFETNLNKVYTPENTRDSHRAHSIIIINLICCCFYLIFCCCCYSAVLPLYIGFRFDDDIHFYIYAFISMYIIMYSNCNIQNNH